MGQATTPGGVRGPSGPHGGGADVPDGPGVVAGQVGEQRCRGVLGGDQGAVGEILVEPLVQASTDASGILAADPGLHGGVDTARPVRVNGDAGTAEFGGEVDGVRLERGLGGGVGVAADHAGRVGGDPAGDVDDTAPAGVQHAGQHGGGERGGGDDVDLEGQAQLPGGDGDGGAERLDGGRVVDQDVDAARREHGHCRAAAVLLIGQVGGHDADPPGGHAPPAEQGA